MDLRGRKLGLLVSCGPDAGNFRHAIGLAEAAVRRGVTVYLYCLDEAVRGIGNDRLQALRRGGVRLFACALAAQRRGIPFDDRATFAGLNAVNEMISFTDRFLAFS
jgi:sulfur relay (sulfurtransferase) complex TusBCD TusD component (DsrE family)